MTNDTRNDAISRKRLVLLFATLVLVWAVAALRMVPAITGLLAATGVAGFLLIPRLGRIRQALRPVASGIPAVTTAEVLLFGLWIGICAGLAEAANAIRRHNLQHLPTGEVVSGEVFWITPLAAVTAFGAIGLLLIALDRVFRARGTPLRLAVPLFVGLATYSLLRALSVGIANYAAVLLALGVATLAVRTQAARPALVRRVVRTTTPWMVGGLIAWALAVPLSRVAFEKRALASLPAPRPGAPNVLVLIWDTARALSLSLYGYERKTTPQLERLAKRGVVFERAFATAPWSLPSHGSIFTGRYPHEMSVGHRMPLDDTHPTLAEVLARHGYVTGGFTGNLFYGSSDYGIARGFSWYDARPPIKPTVVAHTWWLTRRSFQLARERLANDQHMLRRRAGNVNQALLRWIARRGDRPFFAVVNHFDAHQPYLPPEPFNLAFSRKQPRFSEALHVYPPETLRQYRDAYEGSILYLDHELGQLLDGLRDRGVLDNTLLIVTSDHGEEFGEHGAHLVGHARSLYAPVLYVPLVVVYPPRIAGGTRRRETVSIRDIPATVMDVIGLADQHPFPGISLVGYADGSVAGDDAAQPRLSANERHPWARDFPEWPASAGDMFSLVAGELHYILDGKGREHLYDLSRDIWEQHDVAASAGMAPLLGRFRATLDGMVMEDGVRRARAERNKSELDSTIKVPEARGDAPAMPGTAP
jgi:arylsulfatase A-like enzyme